MRITREMLGPLCQAQYDRAMAKRKSLPDVPSAAMNKWESQYARFLDADVLGGRIEWYGFERLTIRLAKRTRYTPDFTVIRNGRIEFHEVKGFWRDDARVKLKVAAEMNRWATFFAVTKKHGDWEWERIIP